MTTVSFAKLVCAASEIATAKDNDAEASNTTVCGVSGEKSNAAVCGYYNTVARNNSGFTEEGRKKHCKA